MKSSRLKYQPISNFSLIAISSSEGMARISWIINHFLKIQLKRSDDLNVFNEKLEVFQHFTCYTHTNMHDEIVFRLIENKSPDGYLCKENSNVDYFLQCIKKTDEELKQTLKKIKMSKDIIFASMLETPNKALTQKLLT